MADEYFKMAPPEGFELMEGSGGGKDYLVLGTFDGFKIGLKPLVDKKYVGFRLRVEYEDKDNAILELQEAVMTRFPTAPWSKFSTRHGSMVGAIPVPSGISNGEDMKTFIETADMMTHLRAILEKALVIDFGVPGDMAFDFLTEAYILLAGASAAGKPVQNPVDSNGTGAKIVPWKPKKD